MWKDLSQKDIPQKGGKMSNFICTECGMTNIDCGKAGYKTPREIELEQNVARLQEQLKEANEVIKDYDGFTSEITPDGKYAFKIDNSARLYLKKWGVK